MNFKIFVRNLLYALVKWDIFPRAKLQNLRVLVEFLGMYEAVLYAVTGVHVAVARCI